MREKKSNEEIVGMFILGGVAIACTILMGKLVGEDLI